MVLGLLRLQPRTAAAWGALAGPAALGQLGQALRPAGLPGPREGGRGPAAPMEAGEAPRGSLRSSARPPTFCSSAEAGSGLSADMAPRQRDGGAGQEGSRERGKEAGGRRGRGSSALLLLPLLRLLPPPPAQDGGGKHDGASAGPDFLRLGPRARAGQRGRDPPAPRASRPGPRVRGPSRGAALGAWVGSVPLPFESQNYRNIGAGRDVQCGPVHPHRRHCNH